MEHAKQQVSSKLYEYTDHCAQLGRPPPPASVPSGSNYTDKLAELEKLISSIAGEVGQRQKLLNVEEEAIQELVAALGEASPEPEQFSGPSGTPALSDVRLHLLRDYKGKLQVLKKHRMAEINELAKVCVQHMTDLVLQDEQQQQQPNEDANTGGTFASCDAALFKFSDKPSSTLSLPLHKNTVSLLTSRCASLVEEKERRREELAKSGAEIAHLWTLLRIPQPERESFQTSFKMNLSLETLAKGRQELDRLLLVRSESLGRVVQSIRQDIQALWDESGIEAESQVSFVCRACLCVCVLFVLFVLFRM